MFDATTTIAIAKIARNLDVPKAALLAVAEVESGGRILVKVKDRNEPLIRFEGHYFDRFLRGHARDKARKAGIASPVAGRVKNPRSQSKRWDIVHRAIVINRVAALSSCSWGLGQVMGAHWKWLGYGSVDALVAEARSGVAGQVALMARYIDRAKLSEALRQQDWAKFARVYNGPAYAKNRYHEKMAAAYSRHVANEKTAKLPEVQISEGALMFGARGAEVKTAQRQLSKAGYVVVADGLFGLVTDRTVRQFQRDHMLPESGIVGSVERAILSDSKSRAVAIAKAKLAPTTKHLKSLSQKLKALRTGWRKRHLSIFNRFN